jgi:tetrahydromethanopterin S-methyltransferase subunit G
MEVYEARVLLKNLQKRIRKIDQINYELIGNLTDDELEALQLAISILGGPPSNAMGSGLPTNSPSQPLKPIPEYKPEIRQPVEETVRAEQVAEQIELDISSLNLPDPVQDRRLCFDFGTAMSKVTLIRDETEERDYEDIEVLHLGKPGDQEEISETMLVSSVFISGDGLLWFGQMAVEPAHLEEDRKRLDNIKHYLSVEGEGLSSKVSRIFNPTDIEITYGDMILAYLMYLTWTVNHCLEELGEPRNLPRRFAMPCFEGEKSREIIWQMGQMLGEAQILADTFYRTLQNGIPLDRYVEAASKLRDSRFSYPFLKEAITEPLGVAGSIMSWKNPVNSLVMVVDVGAGTSDFSLYRMRFDEKTGKSIALEVEKSTQGITEAGNHLDTLLRGLILSKAGVTSDNPEYTNIVWNLESNLRDYKERLFKDNDIVVNLSNNQLVEVSLDEFLDLDQVKKFGQSLINCRDEILNRVDPSFIQGAPHGALGLALTGGGASLPMVKALATGVINIKGKDLKLVQAKEFPQWLADEYPDLEADYPRIAVSLGGARKKVIESGGVAKITAGGVSSSPTLDGFYTKGK